MLNNIRKVVGECETGKIKTKTSIALKKIFDKYGREIISDKKALFPMIDQADFTDTSKQQVKLVLGCSNVTSYLTSPEFLHSYKMTQIDNMLHSICKETGLTYIAAVETLSAILYALGIDCAITYSPILEGDKVKFAVHTILPPDVAEKEIRRVADSFEEIGKTKGKELSQKQKELLEDINMLCSAGIADGFYYLVLCYRNGYLNTVIDDAKADEYMKAAADAGHPEAAAELADKYYNNDDFLDRSFDKAYYYYTKPGSVPLNSERQSKVKDIHAQEKENKFTLAFMVISTILAAVFLAFFNKGLFSDSSRLVVGIIILTLIILYDVAVFVFYFKTSKMNSIRSALFLQIILWMIYIFVLELA